MSPVPIDNISQVYADSVISDTSNWIKISGSFNADSAYSYISFGNFFSDSATAFILYDSLASLAYYYIDDIRVSTDSIFVNKIIEPSSLNLFNIYPNPADDWIFVDIKNNCKISIYNILGNLVFSELFSTSFARINVSGFHDGIYLLNVQYSNQILKRKLIVQ